MLLFCTMRIEVGFKKNGGGIMRFFLLISTFFSLALLTMHVTLLPEQYVCPSGVPEEYDHIEPGKVVAGYFLSWHGAKKYRPEKLEEIADDLTHIMYAFAQPQKDGTCDFLHPKFAFGVGENYVEQKGHFDELADLKKRFPHLKILLSVGGGGCDRTFLELRKNNLLKKYAAECVKNLTQYDYSYEQDGQTINKYYSYDELFDGIDINWEFSPAHRVKDENAQGYLSFVKEVRRLLDKHEKSWSIDDIDINITN